MTTKGKTSHLTCTAVELAGQSINSLNERFDSHCEKQNKNLERIWDAIDGENGVKAKVAEVNDKLNTRLPLWATFLITALSSVAVGLIVLLAK